jgi:hypothetical protein
MDRVLESEDGVLELPVVFWRGGLEKCRDLLVETLGLTPQKIRMVTFADARKDMIPLEQAVNTIRAMKGGKLHYAYVRDNFPQPHNLVLAVEEEEKPIVEIEVPFNPGWRKVFVQKLLRDLGVRVKRERQAF